jgi:hypothetical protein
VSKGGSSDDFIQRTIFAILNEGKSNALRTRLPAQMPTDLVLTISDRGSFPFCALLRQNGTRDTLAGRLGSILSAGLGFDLGEIFPALADIFALACRFS